MRNYKAEYDGQRRGTSRKNRELFEETRELSCKTRGLFQKTPILLAQIEVRVCASSMI